MGDFFYLSVVKDLSNYILTLIEDKNLGANCRILYNGGDCYVINLYVKDIRYSNDFVKVYIKEWVLSVINTYFPKGKITCVVNVRTLL
jgi:hypothetical protein